MADRAGRRGCRAFTVYFHLVNGAGALRAADQSDRPLAGTVGAAVDEVARLHGPAQAQALLTGLEFRPVLTAHPTEARRRAVVTGIRRVAQLLERRDDARLGASEAAETHRRLLEEIDILWRTAQLRADRPGPLDEVRTAMTVFDEVLFHVLPQVYRRAETALTGSDAAVHAPRVPAFIRLGSWIGGDRDGNPFVTSDVTREAMAIQSEHVLRGIERAAARIGRNLTVDSTTAPASLAVRRIIGARTIRPALLDDLTTRSPGEPHRVALLLVDQRVAATRRGDADLSYGSADELMADLRAIQLSLAAAGAVRQAGSFST